MNKKVRLVFLLSLLVVASLFAFSIGDQVKMSETFVGTTKENYSQIVKYSVNKNMDGIMQMMYAGKAFVIEENSYAQVLDVGFATVQIKMISGKSKGRVGWVDKAFVKTY